MSSAGEQFGPQTLPLRILFFLSRLDKKKKQMQASEH